MLNMGKDTARAMLPRVGDRLEKKPHLHKSLGMSRIKPRPCVVTYVNAQNLWYNVRFDDGLMECYKVPEIPNRNWGGWNDR